VATYVLMHLGCLGVFYTGVTGEALAVFCGAFVLRSICVSVILHRFFAHRTFRTSRTMQFLMGLYGSLTVMGGVLWWAQTHRYHHRHADTRRDIHSPYYQGFFYSHCGWFLAHENRGIDLTQIRDLARFPELLWLERWNGAFKLLYIACAWWWFGLVGLVWGFFLPAVIVLHMVHWIQSVSHSIGGYRRFPTTDDSRNHWLFGVLSMGEGFHHNHHSFPGSARLGLRWWEFDLGYYMLAGLAGLGLVWDVREPTVEAYRDGDRRAERLVERKRAELAGLSDRLDAVFAALEKDDRAGAGWRHSCIEARRRMMPRIETLARRLKTLLVAGPFVLQRAEEEMKRSLLEDARAALATPAGDSRAEGAMERIKLAISGEERPQAATAAGVGA
jgi:stearoyl-CoA desaturase (delta-9 desaturase)